MIRVNWILIFVVAFASIDLIGQSDTTKVESSNLEKQLLDESDQEENVIALDSSKIKDMGVAVSPSTMRFRTRPGRREVKLLTITNDTYKKEKFKLSFSDVVMENKTGKIRQVPIGMKAEKYGLSQWISINPSFVEIEPGEKKQIEVILDLPADEDAYKAAWCLLMVDQAKEKEFLVPEGADQEKIAMGVIPTFGFGVYVYQNPPDVEVSRVEITDFTYTFDDDNRYVQLSAKNLGDGISYCKSYLEIVGFNNGFNERLPLKQFNVFPGQSRDFNLQLPGNLEPGSYSVMAVIDFGSDEELQAAEIEITVN